MANSLELGPLTISLYSVMILIGVGIGLLYGKYQLTKMRINSDKYDNLVIFTFAAGIIGARIWYVIANWEYYSTQQDPLGAMLSIWNGGLAIQGGVILGVIALVVYVKKFKPPFNLGIVIDIALPSLLIGQIVGRWGNFFNQEVFGRVVEDANMFSSSVNALIIIWGLLILFGLLVRRPLNKINKEGAVGSFEKLIFILTIFTVSFFAYQFFIGDITDFVVNGMFISGEYRVPLFLIESTLNVVGLLVIVYIIPKLTSKRGVKFSTYFIWYGIVRMILEPLRDQQDILMVNGIMISVVFAGVFILIGSLCLFYFLSNKKIGIIEGVLD